MTASISIDFGSAFTKVAVRQKLNKPSVLISDGKLVSGFCIPTLAARTERVGKPRWAYGLDATEVVAGNGIQVFQNWKSSLFTATPDPEIRPVAVGFFTWLRHFVARHTEPLGVTDLGSVPVRLSVPAFPIMGIEQENSPQSTELLAILAQAGWKADSIRPIISEPETNAIGIYTHGKNSTWIPPDIYPRETCIHFGGMFAFGGYLASLRNRSLRNGRGSHCVLVIDVGAFTTDLAFLEFDLDNEEESPTTKVESRALGVHDLDRLVLNQLPPAKAALITNLDALRREELKRSLYSDERPYLLARNVEIGIDGEIQGIRQCLTGFTNQILQFVGDFLFQNQVTQLHELILTGGGSFIPRLSKHTVNAIVERGLDTRWIHSPASAHSTPRYIHAHLEPQSTRGSSALGGASIYFEDELWRSTCLAAGSSRSSSHRTA